MLNGVRGKSAVLSLLRDTKVGRMVTITPNHRKRRVCVISYLLTATCGPKGHGSGVLLDHILSQIEMIDPSRAPLSPAPKSRLT